MPAYHTVEDLLIRCCPPGAAGSQEQECRVLVGATFLRQLVHLELLVTSLLVSAVS